jgi:hypothetical protein
MIAGIKKRIIAWAEIGSLVRHFKQDDDPEQRKEEIMREAKRNFKRTVAALRREGLSIG